MTSKTHVIEPVPGGPRFRILCIADSTATLCQTKPYVEPVTVDVGGLDARQLAAVRSARRAAAAWSEVELCRMVIGTWMASLYHATS